MLLHPLRDALVLGSLLFAVACGRDDVTATTRTQGRVNQALNSDSDVQVVVRDGVAILTGVTSSEAMHARAVLAARTAEGIRAVDDRIAPPANLTGATVPK